MLESGRGIVLTNRIELPFAPTEDMMVTGRIFSDQPDPMGIPLKEVTWDVDRRMFLADIEQVNVDFPILLIPLELREWLERGWKFGSYVDEYDPPKRRKARSPEPIPDDAPDFDDAEADRLMTVPRSKRPAYYNALLLAIVRQMAIIDNNCSVAYAMQKTEMFFKDSESQAASQSPEQKRFFAAAEAFRKLPFEKQWQWRNRIIRKNPRLEQFVEIR